jgi:hypothetical protein
MTSHAISEQHLVSPITHAGRVVYNAQRDWLETRNRRIQKGTVAVWGNDKFGVSDVHTIQQFELTMRYMQTQYITWSPSDTDVKVFSSANNMQLSRSGVADAAAKAGAGDNQAFRVAYLRKHLQFAGVASNRAIYDPRNNANEEHLAVQVGGLTTLYNTGGKRINTGDVVLWDFPHTLTNSLKPGVRVPGIPAEKRLFATVPMRTDTGAESDMAKALSEVKMLRKAAGDTDIADNIAAVHHIHRRIIGRAFSGANPGQPFDILLGRYMC